MFKTKALSLLKKVGIFAFCVGGYLGLEQLIEMQTKGFCLQKIIADDLPYQPQWETAPLSTEQMEEVDQVLDQPFRLIGSGSECFAFMSEDGQSVIKFFKLGFARPIYYNKGLLSEDHRAYAGTLSNHPLIQKKGAGWLDICRQRVFGIREFRLTRTFSSCKLAYDKLKEETGVFYLHLNPTDSFHRDLTLIDKNGIAYRVPIDSSKFLLQRRAEPLEKHFAKLIREKRYEDAKQSIDSLFSLIMSRCKKGFYDRDFINRNLGYMGNQAIEIDLGSFIPDPNMANPLVYKKELFFATLELRDWLEKKAPELLPYFDERLYKEICLSAAETGK
ncbi:MAG: hypothetical protein JSR39_00085 [Verrucomicrobia bacterium]|nr:hypothetical protein [Verrucomicrobiota bacterium]